MTEHENYFNGQKVENVNSDKFVLVPGLSFLNLYSFFDKKANKFLPPFFALDDADATRQAKSIVNFSNSLICKFPSDYNLHKLGKFCENDGNIDVLDDNFPVLICECSTLKDENSIRYDTLLNEVQKMQAQVASIINDYDTIHNTYVKQLAVLENKSSSNTSKKDVDLFPVKKISNKKKSLIEKLFN